MRLLFQNPRPPQRRHRGTSLHATLRERVPVAASTAVANEKVKTNTATDHSENNGNDPKLIAKRTDALTFLERQAFGKLLPLVDRPDLSDIFVHHNAQGSRASVWVDAGCGAVPAQKHPVLNSEVRQLAVALIAAGDRQLDELHPCADVALGDGIRVHAVLPPIATQGTVISIRLPRVTRLSFADLVRQGLCSAIEAEMLMSAVAERQSILVTGGTGAGKTTLLSALLSEVSASERIITIEDIAELRPGHPHTISLEVRTANSEGAGSIGLDQLLRESLRMRPDRIVLGECRGAEIATMLTALNTGHDGGLSTLHAGEIAHCAGRLEALGALAGLSPQALAKQAVTALDLIIHVTRKHGQYRISGFGLPQLGPEGDLVVKEISAERMRLNCRKSLGQETHELTERFSYAA
jgi:pilus assembly protein CpaF